MRQFLRERLKGWGQRGLWESLLKRLLRLPWLLLGLLLLQLLFRQLISLQGIGILRWCRDLNICPHLLDFHRHITLGFEPSIHPHKSFYKQKELLHKLSFFNLTSFITSIQTFWILIITSLRSNNEPITTNRTTDWGFPWTQVPCFNLTKIWTAIFQQSVPIVTSFIKRFDGSIPTQE